MLVTLGITTYDAAETVHAALAAVLAQDWEAVEIIVVDDASDDATRGILEDYASKDQRVRVFVNEKKVGVAASRNVIVSEAHGEFVAFFDDDDVSAPDRVRRQIERLTTCESQFGAGEPVVCHVARHQNYPDGSSRIERTMGEVEGQPAPSGSQTCWLTLRFPVKTLRRLMIARWNVEGNRAFSRFYAERRGGVAPPT